MSVQIPNVLCIKDITEIGDSSNVIIKYNPFPNMKRNRIYYVLLQKDNEYRIYHIKKVVFLGSNEMRLDLGNSFVYDKPFEYTQSLFIGLNKLGFQELEPGCLVKIKE